MKEILTDVDSVLLDWELAFDEFATLFNLKMIPNGIACYSLHERYNTTEEIIADVVDKFNHSKAFGDIPSYKDAIDGISSLNKEGYKFIAITSAGNTKKITQYRQDNLKLVFGDVFSDIICLPMLANKRNVLKKWKQSKNFWIEDNANNAIDGNELGLKSILVDRPYNRHVTGIVRTEYSNPWKSIKEIILA